MKIIYLIPTSGYATDLRSDTLWGALCWGIRYLWGTTEMEAFINRCATGKPDFVISSTFPYKQHGEEKIPFFPNPFVLAPENDEKDRAKARDNYRLRKKLKKIALLSLDDFRKTLNGELTATELLARLRSEQERREQADKEEKDYTPLPQTVEQSAPVRNDFSMTHNTINRVRGGTLSIADADGQPAGQLFHADEIWWTDPHNDSDASRPNTGLFFLADGDTEKLAPVLRLLRHWGIGADRTTGKGAFDFEIQDFTPPEPPAEKANALLNLSLFRPTESELADFEKTDGCLQYTLEKREGFVAGYREPRPKTPRLCFREGSVFARPAGLAARYMGALHQHHFPELPHEVWDNGFGFMVNLNWKEQ